MAKDESELNAREMFQETANSERDEKRHEKHDYREGIPLNFGQRVEHRGNSIPERNRRNSFSALGLRAKSRPTAGHRLTTHLPWRREG
jgi:hypothetical protein